MDEHINLNEDVFSKHDNVQGKYIKLFLI